MSAIQTDFAFRLNNLPNAANPLLVALNLHENYEMIPGTDAIKINGVWFQKVTDLNAAQELETDWSSRGQS